METRSQSKQQEEQFAKLMAMIQQQQKQQFVDFVTQQQTLLQKQNERWENLKKQQHQANSPLKHFRIILHPSRLMQDRLRATEEVQSK